MSVLASGYIVYDTPFGRSIEARRSGYILYFRIITAGLLLLLLTYAAIYVVISVIIGDFSLLRLFNPEPECALRLTPECALHLAPQYGMLLTLPAAILLRALIRIYIWIRCWFRPEYENELNLKGLGEEGFSQFNQMVSKKIKNEEMLLITLDNGKVYAGWPIEVSESETDKWLSLMPLWSGYRDSEFTINVQVDYSQIFGMPPEERNHTLIPVNKILTAQPFDVGIFEEFDTTSK